MEEKDKKDTLDALDTKKLELEKNNRIPNERLNFESSRWHNEGEKNTKDFLNLEKRHYKQGVISQLKLDNEYFVTTDKEILGECETFYKRLYSSNNGSQNEQTNNFFSGRKQRKS